VTTPLTYALRALKFFQAVSTAVIDVYVDLQNIVLQLKSNTDFKFLTDKSNHITSSSALRKKTSQAQVIVW